MSSDSGVPSIANAWAAAAPDTIVLKIEGTTFCGRPLPFVGARKCRSELWTRPMPMPVLLPVTRSVPSTRRTGVRVTVFGAVW